MEARQAQAVKAYETTAQQRGADGTQTWLARATNFVVEISEVTSGSTLRRDDNPDEYFLFLPSVTASISASGETVDAGSNSLTIIPPGSSVVTFTSSGYAVRIFSNSAEDLFAQALNAYAYEETVEDVAPLLPWPAPNGGYRLRHYPLDQYERDDSNMRLFRSSNLMINVLKKRLMPRDVTALSPHSHKDFEQASIAVEGTYIHHLRYPWGKDMTRWKDDETVELHSPSVLIIPPNVVHTSRNVSEGPSWLIDVFAPPRADFSNKPGLVCNEAEYPMPNLKS